MWPGLHWWINKMRMKKIYLRFLKIMVLSALLWCFSVGETVANCPVSCLPNVEISAGINCDTEVQAHQVLSNFQYGTCNYFVNVQSPSGSSLGDVIPGQFLDQTLNYTVISGGWSCSGQITVVDDVAPVAVCDLDTRISLGSNGLGRVYVAAFDDGSYDNCELASVEIARKYAGNCPDGVVDDTEFRNFVEVCCSDIAESPLEIILRATDAAGNTNTCWAQLYVEDKLPPNIICPSDITVTCDFEFDFDDLSVFGKVALSQAEREQIIIQDPLYEPDFRAGFDGLATDNCGVVVTEDFEKDLKCGKGIIERTFTATDPDDRSAHCTQIIEITELEPFDDEYITWPDDVMIEDCPNGLIDPDVTGMPEIDGDHCSDILFSYTDKIFTQVDGECFKVLRTWSVMDWCQHIPNVEPPVGLWSELQVIKVKTNQAPVIQNCQPKTICGENPDGCSGNIEILQTAIDDCTPDSLLKWTYMIDIDNTGQYNIMGSGNEISGEFPFGTHRVRWSAEDLCGNKSHCHQEITVEDCQQPVPVCHHGISTVVMPISGEVTLNANHFDAGSFDNCTPDEELILAYSNDPADTTRTFDCSELDSTEVEIWVIDQNGNADFCNTYVFITDNHGACLDSLIGFKSGLVWDPDMRPVKGVEIEYNSPDLPYLENSITARDGQYELLWYLIPEEGQGILTATKDHDPLNGFTSFDLLLMQNHITGIRPFTKFDQLIAADINRDGEIDVADVAEGRNVILGRQSAFDNNTSWRIFPAVHDIRSLKPGDPIPSEGFRSPFYKDSIMVVDFDAVKIGDVNRSADPGGHTGNPRTEEFISLHYSLVESGLQLFFTKSLSAKSLQFSLELDVAPSKVRGLEWMAAGDFDYTLFDSDQGGTILTISAVQTNGMDFMSGEPFLIVEMVNDDLDSKTLTPKLAENPAVGEIGFHSFRTAGLELEASIDVGENTMTEMESIRVHPNPSVIHQSVRIEGVDSRTDLEYTLTDAAGRLLLSGTWKKDPSGPESTFELTGEQLPAHGLYYLHLRDLSSGYSQTVKIIRH